MSKKPVCDKFSLWAVRQGPNGEIIGICGKCDRDRSEHIDNKVITLKPKTNTCNNDCESNCYSGESAGPGPGYESDASIQYGYNSDVEPLYGHEADSSNSCEDEDDSQNTSDSENSCNSVNDASSENSTFNFKSFELLFSHENENYEWKCNTCSKMNVADTWEEYMGNPACTHCLNVKNYWVCSNCSTENYKITACRQCHKYGL